MRSRESSQTGEGPVARTGRTTFASSAWLAGVLGSLLAAGLARAQTNWALLTPDDRGAVSNALAVLNMTMADPGFAKDLAEPRWALARMRSLLGDPLAVPALGEEVWEIAVTNEPEAEARALAHWLELSGSPPAAPAVDAGGPVAADLDPGLQAALAEFLKTAQAARALAEHATAAITVSARVAAVASSVTDTFPPGECPDGQAVLAAAGIPAAAVAAAQAAEGDICPDPAVSNWLATATGVRIEDLLAAGTRAREALARLAAAVAAQPPAWPAQPVRVETPAGLVIVGTTGADRFADPALLILDPGGDDLYCDAAGSANGLCGQPLACILDLGGADRYRGGGLLAPGAALFGVACLWDRAGEDLYTAAYVGAAGAYFGAAWVVDEAGDDVYRARGMAQGGAAVGAAVLRDLAGQDRYDVGMCGQGYAGVRAVGLLIDGAGNDRYHAGGWRPDWGRNDGRYLSLSQGYSIGMRPFAGGGLAALVDLGGNDAYHADVYGQGVGYWYAAGLLLDRAGWDTYELYQYGQGSGIHLSIGLLADGGGNDRYTGGILCQGNAHDFAVGLLLDQGGSDFYAGMHHAQGRAINCSFAMLLDRDGDDVYLAQETDKAQGIGDNGSLRDSPSLALLLDLQGKDRYDCGVTNGLRLERPDYGIVYDVEPPTEK